VLQTLDSEASYPASQPNFGEDHARSLNLGDYVEILKRRFFYLLFAFGLVSILGLCLASMLKPNYLSEGKILVESQIIGPDLAGPAATAAFERVQRIQQRAMTRDNLLLIASKFGLFPNRSDIVDLMRENSEFRPVEVVGQQRQNIIAFTVGFEYPNPELAMRVANELVTSIVGEDERSRTSRSTEAVKILTSQTKDIENKLESTQAQILEVARRPREDVSDGPDQEKSQLTALAALKAELIQKTAVYSEAHPAVTALKKRISAMEKTLTQQTPAKVRSTQADEIEALKVQREALEKRLAEANDKLATARLSEKLDRDQQSERLQVIESPSIPQKPLKSIKLKLVGMAFAAAAALSLGIVVAVELFDGSIRSRHQLIGTVASPLIVTIPFITNRADAIRARSKAIFGAVSVVILLAILGGLATAVVLNLPLNLTSLGEVATGFHAAG
jgi:uncharacterized protein involved in exopolysaccharide biosynthesis